MSNVVVQIANEMGLTPFPPQKKSAAAAATSKSMLFYDQQSGHN
jgi:hypothetical protein